MRHCLHTDLAKVCKQNGYLKRGNANFRIIGDGVLQVVKFEYERNMSCFVPYFELHVGLFSMYSELRKSWFTSSGCIPRYAVSDFIGVRNPIIKTNSDGFMEFEYISTEAQLEIFQNTVSKEMDDITTQQKLAEKMCELDMLRAEHIYWNDEEKMVPFFLSGRANDAKKVLEALISQNLESLRAKSRYLEPHLFLQSKAVVEENVSKWEQLISMISADDSGKMNEYIYQNLQTNRKSAGFILSTKKPNTTGKM